MVKIGSEELRRMINEGVDKDYKPVDPKTLPPLKFKQLISGPTGEELLDKGKDFGIGKK